MTFTGHKIWSPFTDQTTVSRWTCHPTTLPPDGMSDHWEHRLWGISLSINRKKAWRALPLCRVASCMWPSLKGFLWGCQAQPEPDWQQLISFPPPVLILISSFCGFFMFNSGVLDVNSNFSEKCIGWRKWEKSHRIDDLVMQSTEKAQCLINGKLVGILECICSALICDSRGKWLLMKGMCFGIQQEGGGNEHPGLWREGSDVSPRLTRSHTSIQ